jgi:CPA1 family monovalent cation:H+ antiporter
LREKFAGTVVLTWAGMRGGISIALALTLPDSPWSTALLVATYAVVVFTIVAQGLTFVRVLHAAYGGEKAA